MLTTIGVTLSLVIGISCPDRKKLISYSRISHINFSLMLVCLQNTFTKWSFSSRVLTHTISRVIIFTTFAIIFHKSHSRVLLIYKRQEVRDKYIYLFFVILLNNIATPGIVRFFTEFLVINILISISIIGFIVLFIYLILICRLSIYLYLILKKDIRCDFYSLVLCIQVIN